MDGNLQPLPRPPRGDAPASPWATLICDAAVALSGAPSADEGCAACLRALCRATGWPLARVRVFPDATALGTDHWQGDEGTAAALRHLPDDEAAPAAPVWHSGDELPSEARVRGVRGVLRVPLPDGEHHHGVLELYSARSTRPDDTLVSAVGEVARILSRALHQAAAQERLRHDAACQEVLAENATGYAVVMLDLGGRVLSWGRSAERMTGRPRDDALDRPWSEGFPLVDSAWQPDGARAEHEGAVRRADGTVFPARLVLQAMHDADGRRYGASLLVHDLGAWRRMEETLAEREERFRLLAEGVKDHALILLDPDGNVTHWSAGAERLHGVLAEEALGRPLDGLDHGDDARAGRVPVMLDEARATGRAEGEAWRTRKDGSRFWAHLVVNAVPGVGAERGFSVLCLDLTERRRIEEGLRESEMRLRMLVDNAEGFAIVMLDPGGRILSWNAGAASLHGYSAREAQGQHLRLLYPQSDDGSDPAAAALDDARAQGRHEEEGVRARRNGQEFWASVVLTAVRDDDGRLRGFSHVARDITERKLSEERLRKLAETLEKRVRERTEQLEDTNRELEAFSYSVSHDLRAPLRSIDGFGQALLEDYADQLDEQGRHYLQRMRAASQRMGELIDDLLRLSRLTRSELQRQRVDLSALAHSIAAELRRRDPGRDVRFLIEDNLCCWGDPRLLRVALENLFSNAWKFTAKHEHSTIEFGTTDYDGMPVYFVRDDGAGFDMAYANKLFGAFQRLHSPAEFEGTGIGLATVQRIIRRHGGRIWAEGAVEQGATFYFNLV